MGDTIAAGTITFVLNDQPRTVAVEPDRTTLSLLRELGQFAVREGCNEGDCGACTVLLGEPEQGVMRYRALNACLLPAMRLHGRHVLTIAGLTAGDILHPIQQAMLDAHAAQCGFCTPGLIMSLLALFLSTPAPSDASIASVLEGHLCRCTGYEAIRTAVMSLRDQAPTPDQLLPACCSGMPARLAALPPAQRTTQTGPGRTGYSRPGTLTAALDLLYELREGYRVLAGGTDLQVERNLGKSGPVHLVDLEDVRELRHIDETDKGIRIGAMTTLDDILRSALVRDRLPLLARAASDMGSAQVRNSATLAGNVATASPIGDGSTALLALNATLELRSADGLRQLPLDTFFLGYRQTALQPGELITALIVPGQDGPWDWRKSARRAAVDIAAVSSAACLTGSESRPAIRLACSGVAATPVLLTEVMRFLHDRRLTPDSIRAAGDRAAAAVSPISDVRGSAGYRRLLVRNHVMEHLRVLAGLPPQLLVERYPGGDA